MMFLDERDALDRVRQGLATSMRADLAVAFWGHGAIEELGIAKRAGKTRIICNLETGGTNPKVVADLQRLAAEIGRDMKVRQNDRLHAKVYLFDDFAVVGSSNASANGLALEGTELTHWKEANILVEDRAPLAQLRRWMKELGRRKILPGDLSRAKAAWRARRAAVRMPSDESQTILEALRFEPEALANLGIFVAIYTDGLSAKGEHTQARLRKEWGTNSVGIFEDWGDLPSIGRLICFHAGTTLMPDGVWERRGTGDDRKAVAADQSVQVAWQVKDVFGKLAVGEGELDQWRSICAAALVGRSKAARRGAVCLPLLDLAEKELLSAEMQSGSFETDVWRSIRELEAARSREKGRAVRLGRTRRKISQVGEHRTVHDLMLSKKVSSGFNMLVDRGMTESTFEAVALRHPDRFDASALAAARARLDAESSRSANQSRP